jgi:adenosylcobinamide-phosphate synthase
LVFLPLHLACSYVLDLLAGDPSWWPHPIRWIGRLISAMERFFHEEGTSRLQQRVAGIGFWLAVMTAVTSGALLARGAIFGIHPILGDLFLIWLGASCLATRSLHQEAARVAQALEDRDMLRAREALGRIVSRDTSQLEEKDIIRALVETVSENISDGVIAPLFYLSVGGAVGGIAYKAVNTMDSMVGYLNDRYRNFGWFAARADDAANWVPSRLSGLLLVAGAFCLRLDWRKSWRIMIRDARKMKSPNAGYPEAAAAGALGVQLGGTNIYFGQPVDKPTLGDGENPLSIEAYASMIRLMYGASLLAFTAALGIRWLVVSSLV